MLESEKGKSSSCRKKVAWKAVWREMGNSEQRCMPKALIKEGLGPTSTT